MCALTCRPKRPYLDTNRMSLLEVFGGGEHRPNATPPPNVFLRRAVDHPVAALVRDLVRRLGEVLGVVGVLASRLPLGQELRVPVAQRPALDVVHVEQEAVRAVPADGGEP